MAAAPRWAGVAGIAIAFVAIALFFLLTGTGEGRADACLGTTDPIQRGVMVNTCDHPISVLACPRDAAAADCAVHSARPKARFEVRADVAVIAHACAAPYVAVMTDDGGRSCQSTE